MEITYISEKQIQELIKKWEGLREICELALKYIDDTDDAYFEWKGKKETFDLLIHDLKSLIK